MTLCEQQHWPRENTKLQLTVMADELLTQVQKLFEGQIVCASLCQSRSFLLISPSGLQRPEERGDHFDRHPRSICWCTCSLILCIRLLAGADPSFNQVVAFTLGFILQNIYVTLWVGLGGAALAFIVVVPPYPFYNQSPEKWLPHRNQNAGIAGMGIEVDGKKVN